MTPKFSIITPTYNCGAFLEDCIQSVQNQGYANFEHIVVDGASTDNTVAILEKYPHVRWLSEPDSGEADALNKALKMVTGDVVGWLNADDFYAPGCLQAVVAKLQSCTQTSVIYGNIRTEKPDGTFVLEGKPAPEIDLFFLLKWWKNTRHFYQPAIFYPVEVLHKVGPFNTELHFSIDYEQWLRVIVHYPFVYLDQTLAVVRLREGAKSSDDVPLQHASHQRMAAPYYARLPLWQRCQLHAERVLFLQTTPLRQKLAFGTRLRSLKAKMAGGSKA